MLLLKCKEKELRDKVIFVLFLNRKTQILKDKLNYTSLMF